jgi:drug/metabolite transporter (DMT)-like permease
MKRGWIGVVMSIAGVIMLFLDQTKGVATVVLGVGLGILMGSGEI